MKIKETAVTKDRFDQRAQDYWETMYGLLNLLNYNNSKTIIRSVESPIITNYLLWRILNELKVLRETQKITENANTRFVSTRKH